MRRPETWFIDIDGTLLEHQNSGCTAQLDFRDDVSPVQPLEGARNLLEYLESRGDTIILVTGRKEAWREVTEAWLRQHKFVWDRLLMGLPGGRRVIVNDKKSDGKASCDAYNPDRNNGVDYILKELIKEDSHAERK
jgi:hypothetical protein